MKKEEGFRLKQKVSVYRESLLRDLVRDLVKFTNSIICYDNFFEIHNLLEPVRMEDTLYKNYLHTTPFRDYLNTTYKSEIASNYESFYHKYQQLISRFKETNPSSNILRIIKFIFDKVGKKLEKSKPHEHLLVLPSEKEIENLNCYFMDEQVWKEMESTFKDSEKSVSPFEPGNLNCLYTDFIYSQITKHFRIQLELALSFDFDIIPWNKKDYSSNIDYGLYLFKIISDYAEWFIFEELYPDNYKELNNILPKFYEIYDYDGRMHDISIRDLLNIKIENVLLRIMKCQECQKYIFDEKHRRRHAENTFCSPQCKDLWHRKKMKREGYYKKWYKKHYTKNSNTAN